MTTAPVSLLDALRQYRLLEPAQLEEVVRDLHRFPEAKALARELLQRGWLTAYQANQLLQGKGQELLLGSYVLLERLGAGGMGQVFKARNWKLGRVVALKMIRKDRLANADAVRRFEREVRSAAALSHPNIVLAYDANQIDGTQLLVMEYVEGTVDLAQLVKKSGALPVAQACEYMRQAALGLQHAHERGLVHRDIKPANLLLTGDGTTIKILDMGLARLDRPAAGDESSTMTHEGAVMGTPDYIAPEQALESHTVDIRADLYSLGCTFYYLLTGRVPFPTGSLLQKLNKHQFEEPKPVEGFCPEASPGTIKVLRKMMAKKPDDRYQTPAEVVMALDSAFGTGNGPFLAPGVNDVTNADEAPVVASPSADSLDSALDYMAQRGETEAVDSPQRLARKAEERRWLLSLVVGGSVGLVGLVVVLFLALKEPARKKPPINAEDPPAKAKVDETWLKQVSAMPAEKQVEAVVAQLKELNSGFDGKVTHKKEGGVVTELTFITDKVTDISPVRALSGLQTLACSGTHTNWQPNGLLADLSPLKNMKLTQLRFGLTQVSDLTPLKNMKLTSLYCMGTQVSDLSPLRDMKLTHLHCASTPVSDLSPLKDMKLTGLFCDHTAVSDLSPLKDMKLTGLHCSSTLVSDLSPLKDMKLTGLDCYDTKVVDLSPLKDMLLKELRCDFKPERDAEILRSIKTLETINEKPAAEVLK